MNRGEPRGSRPSGASREEGDDGMKAEGMEQEALRLRQENRVTTPENRGEIHAVMGSLHKKYFCPEEADSFVDWMVDLGIRC